MDTCVAEACVAGMPPGCVAGEICDEDADFCNDDIDYDGIINVYDNCLYTPNGPAGGTCVEGQFGEPGSKTAMGVIAYGRDPVVAVLDSTRAGRRLRSAT